MSAACWNWSRHAFGKGVTVMVVQYVGAYSYTCVLLNGVDKPVPKGEGYRNLDDICISSVQRKILRSSILVLL